MQPNAAGAVNAERGGNDEALMTSDEEIPNDEIRNGGMKRAFSALRLRH